MHRVLRAIVGAALAVFLLGSVSATEAAAAPGPAACTGVIQAHLAFDSPSVMRGQIATAHLLARNCTGASVSTELIWTGRFLGSSTGIPPGCPAIDPLAKQVTFAPFGQFTDTFGVLIFPSCTATAFSATATFSSAGTVLATATAQVAIVG